MPVSTNARWFARKVFRDRCDQGLFENYDDLAKAAKVSRRSVVRFFNGARPGWTTLSIAQRLVGEGATLEALLVVTRATYEDLKRAKTLGWEASTPSARGGAP